MSVALLFYYNNYIFRISFPAVRKLPYNGILYNVPSAILLDSIAKMGNRRITYRRKCIFDGFPHNKEAGRLS